MSRHPRQNETDADNQPAVSQAEVVLPGQQSVEATASWTGPLPPPGAIEHYENILPGAADRIIGMAERQLEHRIELEKKAVGGDSTRSYLGLGAAFIMSLVAICGSIYIIIQGNVWAGVTIFGIDIVALAVVFVYGTRTRSIERERRIERIAQIRK